MSRTDELRAGIAAHEWYHTLELAPGIETPGWFDLRPIVAQLPLPASLHGKRALDIGTFDGFWAFELERRGGEVTAVDLIDPQQWDWPAGSDDSVIATIGRRKAGGAGFLLAASALGSSVVRRDLSVYDVAPATLGRFDFIFVGSLLLHLRDPIRALECVRSVLDPAGQLLCLDAIDVSLTRAHRRAPVARLDGLGRPWWWTPNAAGLERMITAAGLDVLARPTPVRLPAGAGQPPLGLSFRRLASRPGREALLRRRRGDPHAFVLARAD